MHLPTIPTIANCSSELRSPRYEIEYDENRLQIGRDIGHRFLGIESGGGGGDDGVLICNGGAAAADGATGSETATAAADAGDETDSGIVTKEPRENGGLEDASDGLLLLDDDDELVLDVLNDDLIAHVKEKITREDFANQLFATIYENRTNNVIKIDVTKRKLFSLEI